MKKYQIPRFKSIIWTVVIAILDLFINRTNIHNINLHALLILGP